MWDKQTIARVYHSLGSDYFWWGYFGKGNYISWKKYYRVEDL